jgi:hypothetical protein
MPYDFEKWIAEAVDQYAEANNRKAAAEYGISIAEHDKWNRYAIIDHAIYLIERSYGFRNSLVDWFDARVVVLLDNRAGLLRLQRTGFRGPRWR